MLYPLVQISLNKLKLCENRYIHYISSRIFSPNANFSTFLCKQCVCVCIYIYIYIYIYIKSIIINMLYPLVQMSLNKLKFSELSISKG